MTNYWRTVSVTALPPGITVSLSFEGEPARTWPVLALLHQIADSPDWPGQTIERITLGALNMGRGEIEPVDADSDGLTGAYAALAGVHVPWFTEGDVSKGPFEIPALSPVMSTDWPPDDDDDELLVR